jgi:hypothetical protein
MSRLVLRIVMQSLRNPQAYWRLQGFANLVRARAVLAAKRALAKQRIEHPKLRVGKHLKLD